MITLISLTVLVLAYLFYPIRSRAVDFDEKDEVIKIHREEVAYIKQQHQKALIDDSDKAQWLAELDRKSATSMLAIEQKTYAYRSAMMPVLSLCLGIGASSLLYARFYQAQSVGTWHSSAATYREAIIEGLFDHKVVTKTIENLTKTTVAIDNKNTQDTYCFLLQHQMLRDYSKNPDVLMNVAECHLQLGYSSLAQSAIANALREDPNHLRANTIDAQLQLLQQHRLNPETQAKLTALVEDNPSAVDMGYLLLLNHFSLGEFTEAQTRYEKLQPYVANDPKLKALLSDIKHTIDSHSMSMSTLSPTTEMDKTPPHNAQREPIPLAIDKTVK